MRPNVADIFLELDKEFLASLISTDDLYMNAPCGYFSLHPDGTIIKINRTMCNWLEIAESDVLYKKSFTDILNKGGVIYHEMVFMPLLKMQGFVNEVNFDIKRGDASTFPSLLNAVVVKDNQQRIRAINVTVFNISDRKKYEVQLLNARKEADAEKKRFELLADITPDIIFVATTGGVIEYGNKRFHDYFNINDQLLEQRILFKKIHPADRSRCFRLWIEAIRESKSFEAELRIQNSYNYYVWHLVRAIPYTAEPSSVAKFFGSCINIQEQKELQDKKDEFISLASHELKTPISSLKGYLQIIKQTNAGSFVDNIAQRCLKAVNNMQYLVGSLLDVSHIHSGQLKLYLNTTPLLSLVEESIELVKGNYTTHNIQLDFKIDEAVKVMIDYNRMQQVLINLINNAIKYSPGTNQVVVTVDQPVNTGKVRISVKDFGMGIPAEEQPKIFEKYYRVTEAVNNNKVAGLGLGLYIIKEIVMMHQSDIFLESELHKGSNFYFYLPMAV